MEIENQENQTIDTSEQRTKQETAEVIEAMLNEVGMTKEELVELLVTGINIDKQVDIEIGSEILIHIKDLNENDIQQLGASGADVEALRSAVAAGRDKFRIFEFFTFSKMLQVLSKSAVVFNLEILKRLGIDISPFELERLFNIENVKELNNKNLRMQLATGARQLSQSEIDKLKNYSQDKISSVNQAAGQSVTNNSQKRMMVTDQMQSSQQQNQNQSQQQDQNQQAQNANRPAQQMQQQRSMSRGLRWLRDRTRDIKNRFKDVLDNVERRVDGMSMNMAIAQAEQLNKAITSFANRVKDTYKEVKSVQFKGRDIFVSLRDGSQHNLRDFLKDRGHYSPEMAKLVDEAGSANSELLKVLGSLQKKMLQSGEMSFGENRLLEVKVSTEKEQTKLHVLDYLHDLKKLKTGQGSSATLLGGTEKKEAGQKDDATHDGNVKAKGLEAGKKEPEKDDPKSEKDTGFHLKSESKKELDVDAPDVKPQKQADQLRQNLIKLDALNDSKKQMQELKDAKSLFNKGMSAMGEAKKNKTSDVMKEMKNKMQPNKQIV